MADLDMYKQWGYCVTDEEFSERIYSPDRKLEQAHNDMCVAEAKLNARLHDEFGTSLDEVLKQVLLEIINSTRSTYRIQIQNLNQNILMLEAELSTLPAEQQRFLKLKRKYDISQEAYDVYMSKEVKRQLLSLIHI